MRLPFGLGLLGSILATLLVRVIALTEIARAAGAPVGHFILGAMALEVAAGLVGIWGWQLWAARRHDRRILVAELAGSVLGTGLALRYGW